MSFDCCGNAVFVRLSAYALDAEPEREAPDDPCRRRRDARAGKDRGPLAGSERSRDRECAVLAYDAVDTHDPGKQGKARMGEGVAVEIADQPAAACVVFHVTQKFGQLRFAHVMRSLAADDKIEIGSKVLIDTGVKFYAEARRRCLARGWCQSDANSSPFGAMRPSSGTS